jgi:hypothetical protein
LRFIFGVVRVFKYGTGVGAMEAGVVAGNTAVITPESAECVTDIAPATVKKLADAPVSVKPDVGVTVIVAVYVVAAAKVEGEPLQVITAVY